MLDQHTLDYEVRVDGTGYLDRSFRLPSVPLALKLPYIAWTSNPPLTWREGLLDLPFQRTSGCVGFRAQPCGRHPSELFMAPLHRTDCEIQSYQSRICPIKKSRGPPECCIRKYHSQFISSSRGDRSASKGSQRLLNSSRSSCARPRTTGGRRHRRGAPGAILPKYAFAISDRIAH